MWPKTGTEEGPLLALSATGLRVVMGTDDATDWFIASMGRSDEGMLTGGSVGEGGASVTDVVLRRSGCRAGREGATR